MKKCISLFFFAISLLLHTNELQALKPKSKYFASKEDADNYLTMRYNAACDHYNKEEWKSAASHFEKVIFYFPCTDDAALASYYLAVCYYQMKEYDFANAEFTNYLKASVHPLYFEDALEYKFCIAELFKSGKKKRPFTMRYLPKWISAHDAALETYDEIVAAIPNHCLAVKALFSKGELLIKMGEYKDAIETYQMIIRRFPKNEIIPECYLKIAECYVEQSRIEFQNPDILGLAELNVRRFQEEYPREERLCQAIESIQQIKESYAKGLCDIGLFYERKKLYNAALIYFKSAIEEFPDTDVAKYCRYKVRILSETKVETSEAIDADTEIDSDDDEE